MTDHSEIYHHIQDALTHLHDPDYRATEALYRCLGIDAEEGSSAVQSALIRLIETGFAASQTPAASPARLDFDVLYRRFAQRLTQEETAAQLNISVRTLQRVQRRAIYLFARQVGQLHPSAQCPTHPDGAAQTKQEETTPADWQAQVKQELSVLGQSASAKRVDLAEVVAGVLALGQSLAISRDVVVRTGHLAAGLNAAIHLSALRQLLITILGEMIESMQGGELILEVKEEEDHAAVWIRCPSAAVNRPSSDLIHEITVAYGGSFSWHDSGENRGVALRIPVADRSFAVLVVDDNTELVHFYRHYTQDTPYRITHLTDGARLLDVIQTERPDVIVLDVMLPGVDGWDLLVQLRRQSASRAVPVIVCSVIRAENLALTMGAAHYLPKPVRRQEFIRALDRVLSSRSEAAGLDDGHSASAGTG